MSPGFRFRCSGPRWARFDIAAKDLAHSLGLRCEVDRDTTILREHVRGTVTGDEDVVNRFAQLVQAMIEDYNRE